MRASTADAFQAAKEFSLLWMRPGAADAPICKASTPLNASATDGLYAGCPDTWRRNHLICKGSTRLRCCACRNPMVRQRAKECM